MKFPLVSRKKYDQLASRYELLREAFSLRESASELLIARVMVLEGFVEQLRVSETIDDELVASMRKDVAPC